MTDRLTDQVQNKQSAYLYRESSQKVLVTEQFKVQLILPSSLVFSDSYPRTNHLDLKGLCWLLEISNYIK